MKDLKKYDTVCANITVRAIGPEELETMNEDACTEKFKDTMCLQKFLERIYSDTSAKAASEHCWLIKSTIAGRFFLVFINIENKNLVSVQNISKNEAPAAQLLIPCEAFTS